MTTTTLVRLGLAAVAVILGLIIKGRVHPFLALMEDCGPRMLQGEAVEVRSALDIFVTDMGLVTDAARAVAQPVPLAAAAEQLYVRGRREGHGRHDDSSVYDILRPR
ncbi:NAD-binding protein [Kocuria turfanensis]|uniref:NAD-binding protein n=1 Tax=Kocuria turfanensis TaxID=388357 RepID=UPI00078870C8|nr:NAD-binding protein [Kocuria turfanensis]